MNDLCLRFSQIRDEFLSPCAINLERKICEILSNQVKTDRISSRVKGVNGFLEKAQKIKEDGSLKYPDPLSEIQDLIGVRVVVLFLEDVEKVKDVLFNYFRPIEYKGVSPKNDNEFSYFGFHAIFHILDECIPAVASSKEVKVFELQVKTIFQHAWSEAEHDIGYKPQIRALSSDEKRNLGFAASLAWGADNAFDDVLKSLKSE